MERYKYGIPHTGGKVNLVKVVESLRQNSQSLSNTGESTRENIDHFKAERNGLGSYMIAWGFERALELRQQGRIPTIMEICSGQVDEDSPYVRYLPTNMFQNGVLRKDLLIDEKAEVVGHYMREVLRNGLGLEIEHIEQLPESIFKRQVYERLKKITIGLQSTKYSDADTRVKDFIRHGIGTAFKTLQATEEVIGILGKNKFSDKKIVEIMKNSYISVATLASANIDIMRDFLFTFGFFPERSVTEECFTLQNSKLTIKHDNLAAYIKN